MRGQEVGAGHLRPASKSLSGARTTLLDGMGLMSLWCKEHIVFQMRAAVATAFLVDITGYLGHVLQHCFKAKNYPAPLSELIQRNRPSAVDFPTSKKSTLRVSAKG